MHQHMLASFLLLLPLAVQAEALVLSDLKAQNGIQLSADELKQLLPGAKVVNHTEAGNTRRWTNEPDGKLVASNDGGAKVRWTRHSSSSGDGTWRIGDNGTYCVTLEWKKSSEDWCRYLFKVGAKYYGVGSAANSTAKAHEFEFSK
jgi:hypothetical protein